MNFSDYKNQVRDSISESLMQEFEHKEINTELSGTIAYLVLMEILSSIEIELRAGVEDIQNMWRLTVKDLTKRLKMEFKEEISDEEYNSIYDEILTLDENLEHIDNKYYMDIELPDDIYENLIYYKNEELREQEGEETIREKESIGNQTEIKKNTLNYQEAESLIKELEEASKRKQQRELEFERTKRELGEKEYQESLLEIETLKKEEKEVFIKAEKQKQKTEEARRLRLKEEEAIKIREEQRLKKDREEQEKTNRQREMDLREDEYQKEMNLQEAEHEQRLKEQEIELQKAEVAKDTEEIQRQNNLKEYPVGYHLKFLLEKLDEVFSEEFKGEVHSSYIELYSKMNETFQRLGIISPDKLVLVKEDVLRINQIETIMDLYDEKIRNVKSDKKFEDEIEREEKIDNWKRLRDRDIAEIEQS